MIISKKRDKKRGKDDTKEREIGEMAIRLMKEKKIKEKEQKKEQRAKQKAQKLK